METKPVTVKNSHYFIFTSNSLGREFKIFVSLPYAYGMSEVESGPFSLKTKWPVVYLLDANWHFDLVTGAVHTTAWDQRASDAIVIGVGYPEKGENSRKDWWNTYDSRALDLTPCIDKEFEQTVAERFNRPIKSGGGEAFLTFLQTELIPYIEGEYDVDSKRRILAGHSLGGLFSLFALLHQQQLFSHYVIGSPSLHIGNKFMFEYEEITAQKRKDLRASIYFSVGELEDIDGVPMVSNMLQFISLLESRQYQSLLLVKQVFREQDHCEVSGQGFHSGLKWALQD